MDAAWTSLAQELSRWQEAGRSVDLWWRDDDAIQDTPALRRLIAVAQVPVALAVIPGAVKPDLPQALATAPSAEGFTVLQHGFRHLNHEPATRKKAELGAARAAETVAAELAAGWTILQQHFGTRAIPVLTPPWNRIAPEVVARLPRLGFRGLTTYLPRRQALAATGLRQVNTHVDIIDWHGGRSFLGIAPTLALLENHLRARRLGAADAAEPTGLLTHHLVQDAESWTFLQRLQDWLSRFPMIRWLPAMAVFPVIADRMEQ